MSKMIRQLPNAVSMFVLLFSCGFSVASHSWEGHQRAPWVGNMLNGTECDGGQVPFGPYDYLQRGSLKAQLEVVEESHFNEDVESLAKGMSATAMGDIHYTLQTWPNHHRALNSAVRFRLQHRELWGQGDNTAQNYPAECYLQRAINFSPNDPIPYMLHGMLMHQMQQYETALKSYREAIRLKPDDLITQYNMGLTLVELKKFQEAQKIADKVYAADFPLPGLQRKLAAAKQQTDQGKDAKPNAGATAGGDTEGARPEASPPQAPESKEGNTPAKNVVTTSTDEPAGPTQQVPDADPAQKAVAAKTPPVEPNAKDERSTTMGSTPTPAAAAPTTTPGATSATKETAQPPNLTPEQLAIIKQALKDQAAKKQKAAESSAP